MTSVTLAYHREAVGSLPPNSRSIRGEWTESATCPAGPESCPWACASHRYGSADSGAGRRLRRTGRSLRHPVRLRAASHKPPAPVHGRPLREQRAEVRQAHLRLSRHGRRTSPPREEHLNSPAAEPGRHLPALGDGGNPRPRKWRHTVDRVRERAGRPSALGWRSSEPGSRPRTKSQARASRCCTSFRIAPTVAKSLST